MSRTVYIGIKALVNVREESPLLFGSQLAELPCLEDAYLTIDSGRIADYGRMQDFDQKADKFSQAEKIDLKGSMVLPCWCDSHTHLVFMGSREGEFVDKIKGKTYAEIQASGGGIQNSARRMAAASEDELFDISWQRLQEAARLGTGAIEIKSGYGLTPEAELKMLRVIRRLKEKSPLTIKATFLGAHTYPDQFRHDHVGYLRLITEEMLPRIAKENLADYVDVFCESGFFSPEETRVICQSAAQFGLLPKLHVNQLSSIGGIQAAIELNAVSVDHLEVMTDQDIRDLANRQHVLHAPPGPIATLLPTAAFFLRMPYQPARKLLEAGCAVALASDFNPGSSPSSNMNFVLSLSCIQMRMLPEEAINAASLNGAHAMDCAKELGSITVGKKANLIITKPIPSVSYVPYSFGNSWIDRVLIGGKTIV